MNDNQKELFKELSGLQKLFDEHQDIFKADSEELWNSLDRKQQLLIFCAVIRRLYKYEILENLSYRGVLYDGFRFDIDSYGLAQDAGYLKIHNSIYSQDEILDLFKKVFEHKNIEFNRSEIENLLKL